MKNIWSIKIHTYVKYILNILNILGVVKRNPLFFHSISCKNGFLFTTPNIKYIKYIKYILKYILKFIYTEKYTCIINIYKNTLRIIIKKIHEIGREKIDYRSVKEAYNTIRRK